jgi:hypothetical protein
MVYRSACTGVAVAALVVAAIPSCSVDERTLSRATASSGAPGVSDADPGAFPEGGQAEVDAALAPLPVCDYGTGVQAGCETLVSNPGFMKDVSGWNPEDSTVTMNWTENDAASNKASGSLSVVNTLSGAADGISSRGASQCLPTAKGKAYGFACDLFIPNGQGAGLDGGVDGGPDGGLDASTYTGEYDATAGLSVIFYTSEQCDGYTLANATSTLADMPGSWVHREGHAVAPDGANSMSVRLVTFKNFREFTFQAWFDNILVKEE